MINQANRDFFDREGYLIIKGFYDLEADILPMLEDIYRIIGLVAARHGVALSRPAFLAESFDQGYGDLLAANRRYAGEVYDLVKQIPSFIRFIAHPKAEALFREMRGTNHAGIGAASYGIRIDNPSEEKFRSHWHQEFVFQPQSMDGIVFWTPLLPMKPELGPVVVLPRSNRDGLCIYARGTTYADKAGAYQIGIHDEDAVVARYEHIAPLTDPTDLLLMDFLTIHGSGYNISNRSRWSVQSRFFNFNDPVGMKVGWRASITAGTEVEEIFPDNFVRAE